LRFIAQKKGIAAGLTALLLGMAAYNIVPCLSGFHPHPQHVGCCHSPE